MIRAWNALVCRAWYACGCPPSFPLRQIRRRGRLREGVDVARGEFRAGRADARRTPGARWWHGRRWGDLSYAAGYAAGALRRPL